MARVRSENQLSREREKVTVAPTASNSAGSAAMIENSATMRMCRRAPGIFSRQARASPTTCQASSAIMARMSTTLRKRTTSTTSPRGAIGVRPVRMR